MTATAVQLAPAEPDVSPAGIARAARAWEALTADLAAQGYRWTCSYRNRAYFVPVRSPRLADERVMAWDEAAGTWSEVDPWTP